MSDALSNRKTSAHALRVPAGTGLAPSVEIFICDKGKERLATFRSVVHDVDATAGIHWGPASLPAPIDLLSATARPARF